MSGVSAAERLARLTLSLIGDPGDIRFTGPALDPGPEEFLTMLREGGAFHEQYAAAAARLSGLDPERELEIAHRMGVRFVVPGDDEWPAQLGDLAHGGALYERGGVPIGLWVKGPMRLDELAPSVAVVGSRSSTTYGEVLASQLCAEVALAGRPIVSGAAFGIDYAAHRGALGVRKPTVAVLACGVDRAYPEAHRELLRHLHEHHAVISEAPVGAAPLKQRFLARNRLIAALAQGTVVVEASHRSGALSTTNWAQRLSRQVMGTPGPVDSAASVGVHHLIRSGGATLVTGGKDVLELLGAAGECLIEEPRGPSSPRDRLAVRALRVLDAVPVYDAAPTESVARVAGLSVAESGRLLGDLQRSGLVERVPTGWRITERARA